MKLPGWVKKIITVDDSVLDDQFILLKDAQNEPSESSEDNQAAPSPEKSKSGSKKPMPLEQFIEQGSQKYNEEVRTAEPDIDDHLPADLDKINLCIKTIFHMPKNKDIVIREFCAGTERPWRGFIVFVDGVADKTIINEFILQPLMVLTHVTEDDPKRRMDVVSEKLLPGNQVDIFQKWSEVVPGILSGSTAVFLHGCDAALIVETKGWEHRTVGPAQTENVVRGPHDGFTESFRANTGLVRARLKSEHLVTEMFSVGELARTDVAVMYIEGIVNQSLVEEVSKRIKAIDVDYLPDSGGLEQFIEDKPSLLIPQVLSTERPDRVAHMLTEGHVAIFVGNSPFAIVAPVVLWTLVHTPEDAYLRWQFGTFLRFLRWVALGVALLLPAFYVAVTNYHPEMIPTDLMLAIAGSREQVPFPVVVEILLMEFAIELIREAGIRIPSVIGPTIGIVGALIIGQAAVQAGIVSPLLVIVVATTALAAFTIPNYNLNLAVRLTRFVFLAAASVLGFYGIAILMCVFVVRLSIQKSFGVPMLSPVAPSQDSSPDVLTRGPVFLQNQRPTYMQTKRDWRQQPITRPWSSATRPEPKQRKKDDGKK